MVKDQTRTRPAARQPSNTGKDMKRRAREFYVARGRAERAMRLTSAFGVPGRELALQRAQSQFQHQRNRAYQQDAGNHHVGDEKA